MSSLALTQALARPDDRRAGWCPSCHKVRPATLATATTEWQVESVYSCDSCGAVIRDVMTPLIASQEMSVVATA